MFNASDIVDVETTDIAEPTGYISVDEVASLLSIARATAYQLTKTDGFPCFYTGKRIIIPLRSFNKWAEELASTQAVLFRQ